MKFSIDIDCTPEEARAFLGLPDVTELQQAMVKDIQDRMSAHIAALDPDTLMKTWMPVGTQAWETFQNAFMRGFAGPSADDKKD